MKRLPQYISLLAVSVFAVGIASVVPASANTGTAQQGSGSGSWAQSRCTGTTTPTTGGTAQQGGGSYTGGTAGGSTEGGATGGSTGSWCAGGSTTGGSTGGRPTEGTGGGTSGGSTGTWTGCGGSTATPTQCGTTGGTGTGTGTGGGYTGGTGTGTGTGTGGRPTTGTGTGSTGGSSWRQSSGSYTKPATTPTQWTQTATAQVSQWRTSTTGTAPAVMDNAKKSCESRKDAIIKKSENYTTAAEKQLSNIDSQMARLKTFATDKNVSSADLTALIKDLESAKTTARTAVSGLADVAPAIDCNAADPAIPVATTQDGIDNVRKALQDFREGCTEFAEAVRTTWTKGGTGSTNTNTQGSN